VLRLMLTEAQSWDKLGNEEHVLLSELPPPHGPLFIWLESQLHEHGPQPWAALREALRGHPQETYAVQQLAQIPEGIEADWDEVRSILRQLGELKRQQALKQLAEKAASDPAAMQLYRELLARSKTP
jgi:DNA primase